MRRARKREERKRGDYSVAKGGGTGMKEGTKRSASRAEDNGRRRRRRVGVEAEGHVRVNEHEDR